ncbi:hypothetical protein Ares1_0073 [Vibrio phage Ares1]|nr:hypothetical protein Ares1_0073 [Vibrio phage Ares1]
MLNNLNLQEIKPVGVADKLSKDLTRVCFTTVSKLQHAFLIDEAFTRFFDGAVAAALTTPDGLATQSKNIVVRYDYEQGIIAFSLEGLDGAKKSGHPFATDSLCAKEEINAIGLVAGAQIELFKTSPYTLIGRVTSEHLTADPFKHFTNLLECIARAYQSHSHNLDNVCGELEKLLGRKVDHLGDSIQVRLAARRILADTRVSQGLKTTQQLDLPPGMGEVIKEAVSVALSGYYDVEDGDGETVRTARVHAHNIDKLIKAVNDAFETDIKANGDHRPHMIYNHQIKPKLERFNISYTELDPEPQQEVSEEAAKPEKPSIALTGDVMKDQYNFKTLEDVDNNLFHSLALAGFYVENVEKRRRADIALPIAESLLKEAIKHVAAIADPNEEGLAVEIAVQYAKLAGSNKSVATRAELVVTFSQLCAALAIETPKGTLEDCTAFVCALHAAISI